MRFGATIYLLPVWLILLVAEPALAQGDGKPSSKGKTLSEWVTLLQSSKEPRRKLDAAEALGAMGPAAKAAIPALIENLGDDIVQLSAAAALAKIGKDAVADLLKALKDKNNKVRSGAAYALGAMGPTAAAAVPALIEARRHDSVVGVKIVALAALAQIGKPAVPALIKALKDKDPENRGDAAIALGNIGPAAKEAVPALIEALKDSNSRVQILAGGALRKIDEEAWKKAGRP